MPRYDERKLVYVVPYAGATIKYGFMTNSDKGTILGHVAVTGAYPVGLIIGANNPKPNRASKQFTTGVESSFIDVAAIDAARSQGWRIRPGTFKPGAATRKAKCVYVAMGGAAGVKYAWMMPNDTYANVAAAKAALGIQDATASDDDLVFGARYPKPPRVGTLVGSSGGSLNLISTFCDPEKLDSLPAGWMTVKATRTR